MARIGWKKAGLDKDKILKLEILGPVVCPYGFKGKRRTNKVKVVGIFDLVYFPTKTRKSSMKNVLSSNFHGGMKPFWYKLGRVRRSVGFDRDTSRDCGAGINFFDTRREAMEYF